MSQKKKKGQPARTPQGVSKIYGLANYSHKGNSMTFCKYCGSKIYWVEIEIDGEMKWRPRELGEIPHKCKPKSW